jgi:hypothetical protein
MPAQSDDSMPFIAAIADIRNDPEVCCVSLLSPAGCTTLIIESESD